MVGWRAKSRTGGEGTREVEFLPTASRIRRGVLDLTSLEVAQVAGSNTWEGQDSEGLCGKEQADSTSPFLLPINDV